LRNKNETRIKKATVNEEKYGQASMCLYKACGNFFDANPSDDVYKKYSSAYQCRESNRIQRSCQYHKCNSNCTKLYWHPKVYNFYDYAKNEEIHYCDRCLRGKAEIFQTI
jgi:hypothetical protein